jgi:hypothetical protein
MAECLGTFTFPSSLCFILQIVLLYHIVRWMADYVCMIMAVIIKNIITIKKIINTLKTIWIIYLKTLLLYLKLLNGLYIKTKTRWNTIYQLVVSVGTITPIIYLLTLKHSIVLPLSVCFLLPTGFSYELDGEEQLGVEHQPQYTVDPSGFHTIKHFYSIYITDQVVFLSFHYYD